MVKRKAEASAEKSAKQPTETMVQAALMDDMIDDDGSDSESGDGAEEEIEDEMNDDQGVEDLEADEEPAQKRQRTSEKSLYRPATIEEMDLLRREELDRGSGSGFGFGMKLTELLATTFLSPPSPTFHPPPPPATLSSVLSHLHSHLLSLPNLPALSPQSAAQRLSPHVIPFVNPEPVNVKWSLDWQKPKEILVVGDWSVMGSFVIGKGKGKEVLLNSTDLAVVMPEAMFSPKDRTANRYFHKRAHYLTVIAASLASLISKAKKGSSPLDKVLQSMSIEWEYIGGDERRPGLVLSMSKDKALGLKHPYKIRILPSLPPNVFALSSLYPSKSNLKVQVDSEADSTPTPIYNTSILLDTTHRAHLLHLNHLQTISPSVRAALGLWRIWGARRGLDIRTPGWSWLGSMIFGLIIEGGETGLEGKDGWTWRARKGLGRGLSEWQLLRAGWEFLSSTDFTKTPVLMKNTSADKIPSTEFVKAFQNVFVDPTGTINLFASWNEGDVNLLKYEAKATLNMLAHTASSDRFDEIFMRSSSLPSLQYDDAFTIELPEMRGSDIDSPSTARETANAIATLLQRGLGKRARIVAVGLAKPASWSTIQSRSESEGPLQIGLVLDKDHAFNILDQGPPSEDAQGSKAFRELWGSKAELRRFKDGSITESVVWNIARPEEGALIPGMIVKWLLSHHFQVDEEEITWRTPDFLPLIQVPQAAHRMIHAEGSEKTGFRPLMEAFDSLYKTLKAADDDLPLSVLNFSPMDSALRYSSTFIPHPLDLSRAPSAPDCIKYMSTVDVLIQFESSRKWPDDLVAIQKIKLAVLTKTGQVIEDKVQGVKTSVVLEPNVPDIQDQATLEVIMPTGHAFHLHVHHDRERTLLERMIEDHELPSEKVRRIAQDAYALHFRRFTSSARHHGAILALHHMFPSFASATRLLKRWVASHLLSEHFPEEVLELIMASIYLDPGVHDAPTMGPTGFARAIDVLAHWNWREQVIMVPLYTATRSPESGSASNVFPPDDLAKAQKAFEALRKSDKDHSKSTMVVGTEEDLTGRAWLPSGSPHRMIASRLVTLAQATLRALQTPQLTVKNLFETDLSEYDFVIHLDPRHISRLSQSIAARDNEELASLWENHIRNQAVSGLAAAPVQAGLDVQAAFFADLQRMYGEQAIFFHDVNGGSVITALWNPDVLQHRSFKPFLGYNTKPVESSTLVEINKTSILSEIERLGQGIITRIEVSKA